MDNTHKSQKQRLQEQFELIVEDVTAGDRKAAVEELGYTKMTLSRYLNGSIDDNDTAVQILKFFRNRIAERDKAVAA